LLTLASRHDVTPNNIAAWNKLKMPALLKPGQSIAILVPTTSSSKGSKSIKGSGKKANNAAVNGRKQDKTSNSSSAKSKSAVQAKGPSKPKAQP
jgi:hypothetical protein